jgi:hypothetical protein
MGVYAGNGRREEKETGAEAVEDCNTHLNETH